jgi:hypothetical protein
MRVPFAESYLFVVPFAEHRLFVQRFRLVVTVRLAVTVRAIAAVVSS